jgi:O-antigen/teichoic acid export membrane protein
MLAGGTALGQAITVLVAPLLTRLYTPEDFGVLAVYTSTLGILSVIASWRYELAIPLSERDEDAANLLVLSIGIVALMSLLVGLGTWLGGEQIVQWLNAPGLRPYLWLWPIGVLLVGTYQVFNYWAVRKRAFDRIARTKINQGLGAVAIQTVFGLLKLGPLGLLIGHVVGQGAGTTTLAILAHREDKKALHSISFGGVRRMARRYQRYPLLSSFSGLINSVGLQLPAILLASFYGLQVAGWFTLGQRVIGAPMALVGQAVSQVYLGEAAQLARQNPSSLRSLFLKAASRLLLLGLAPLGLLALSGPWLFAQIFGAGWRDAGIYIQVLSLMFLVQFVVVPLSQTLNILERQDWQLGWDIGRLLTVTGTLLIARMLGWLPSWAIAAYSMAMLISYIALFGLSLRALLFKEKVSRDS